MKAKHLYLDCPIADIDDEFTDLTGPDCCRLCMIRCRDGAGSIIRVLSERCDAAPVEIIRQPIPSEMPDTLSDAAFEDECAMRAMGIAAEHSDYAGGPGMAEDIADNAYRIAAAMSAERKRRRG